MANADRAYGLRAVKHINGSPYNGATQRVYIPASEANDIFIGSPVKSLGNGDADGVPSVTLGTAGDTLLGAVISFDVDPDNLSNQYRTASTERYAKVAVDPDVVFEVQEDADGAALTADDIGKLADLTAESGSTTSGLSSVELDSSTAGSGSQVRILGFTVREDNSVGDDNAKVLVRIADHEYDSATGIA